MIAQDSENLARQAELIYQQQLKEQIEQSYPDQFVAIEPLSGDYFMGRTLSEALGAARNAHPDRLSHAIRVGHKSALHFGTSLK